MKKEVIFFYFYFYYYSFFVKTTFFEEKKMKEEYKGYKKPTHKRRELPLRKKIPTMENNIYKIVIKSLWNRSLQRNMKTTEGPNLSKVSIHTSKHRTILLAPKTQKIAQTPASPKKWPFSPRGGLRRNSTIIALAYVMSNHDGKCLEERILDWTCKLTTSKNMVRVFLYFSTKNTNRKVQQTRATSSFL